MRLSRISTVLFALGLSLAACAKKEEGAAAPAPAPAAEAPKAGEAPKADAPAAEAPKADAPAAEAPKADAPAAPAAPATADLVAKSAEEAFAFYSEGTKAQDGEKLWAVMPKMQQVMMDQVKGQALQAPAEQLAAMNINGEEIKNLSAKQFFIYMVKKAPLPANIPSPTDVKIEAGAEANIASATFKLENQDCKAQLGAEEGAWKVLDLQCAAPAGALPEHAPAGEAVPAAPAEGEIAPAGEAAPTEPTEPK